jgi:F0F1-type ATP synthase membrane subunit b/b'
VTDYSLSANLGRHIQAGLAAQPDTQIQQGYQQGVQAYTKLYAGYFGPLQSDPKWSPGTTTTDPVVAQQIAAQLSSLNNHPLQQGASPSKNSPLTNQASDGQAQNDSVLGGIWRNTFGAWIRQAQANPLAAAGEVLAGVALVAGAGALDVATGGLATPILWTGFAALALPHILPAFVSSAADAMHDPNDVNVSRFLINAGTAAITLGSPVKSFRGVGALRSMIESDSNAVRFMHQPGEAVQLVTKGQAGKKLPYLLPEDRFSVVPQTEAALEKEIANRKAAGQSIDQDPDMIERYRGALREHDILADQLTRLAPNMEEATSHENYMAQITDQLNEMRAREMESAKELIPIQKQFAHRYGYTLAAERPMQRLTKEEYGSIKTGARARANSLSRSMWGMLHAAGDGHGWDGAPDGMLHTTFAENMAEAMARGDAAGGLNHAQRLLETHIRELGNTLGVGADRMDHVYASIEGHPDPEQDVALWNNLSGPEKLMAEKMNITFGIMTNFAYRHGFLEVPLVRYVPRMVMHEDPALGRGVSATSRLMESLAPPAAQVKNRSWALDGPGGQQSDWSIANESQAAEFDPEEGMGTISERLRQTHLPWMDFDKSEQDKRVAYQETTPLRSILKDPEVNQALLETRRAYGGSLAQVKRLTQNLSGSREQVANLAATVRDFQHQLDQHLTAKAKLKSTRGMAQARTDLEAAIKDLRNETRKASTQHQNLIKQVRGWESSLATHQAKIDSIPREFADKHGLDALEDLVKTDVVDSAKLRSITTMQPGGRYLMSGYELPRLAVSRYLRQMNQARYREAWKSISYSPKDQTMDLAYGAGKGETLAEVALKDASNLPIAITSDIKLGDIAQGDTGRALMDQGYEMVMPEVGRRGEQGSLNYQPAIYGRKDIVGKYRELAQQARSASDFQSAFARSVYNASVGVPKRIIMGSPAWHGKNVFGRALAAYFQDPSMFGQAVFRELKNRFHDQDAYYATKMEHWMDGGVPANRFNVTEHLHHLEQQMSGQRTFLSALRSPLGPLSHAHAELAERWFWKTVDDIGTAAYVVQKQKLMSKRSWMSERMAGMLAAEHANNVAGMVNPLYMSKLWRWGRQMLFFAPTWWTTFARMAGQAIPGSARISHLLNKSGALGVVDPVKFHSLDLRQRKELVRVTRGYFMSYMSAAMLTHDMMNYLFSGHHVWDNQKGHEWDVEMDHAYAPKLDPSSGQTKHVHVKGMFYFSQMADMLNAIGLGHDWGFLHQMHSGGFQQADDWHKAAVIGSSLADGFRQQAAGKASTAVNLGIGMGLGIDPYSLMRSNQVNEIPRWEMLAGMLPGGFQAQRVIDQQRRAAMKAAIEADPNAPPPDVSMVGLDARSLGAMASAAGDQFIGMPSLAYTGDEPANGYHFLSEQESTKYLQSRGQILQRKQSLSGALLNGDMTPADWVQQNEMQTQRYLQLLSDTYGNQADNSANSLFTERKNLYTKYSLDNPSLSQGQRAVNTEAFDAEWQGMLNNASPQVKAQWWDAHTAMWTDADYLYWMTGQIKQAIQSHIDGEGGNLIRQSAAKLNYGGLPVDTTKLDQMRQNDPYLWIYHQVMSQLGKFSLLGALAGSYYNPYPNFAIFPDDQAAQIQQMEQAGLLKGGAVLARASTMHELAAAARMEAGTSRDPATGQILYQTPAAEAGGQFGQTAEGQQLGQQLSNQAIEGILQKYSFSPQGRAYLERLLAGGSGGPA